MMILIWAIQVITAFVLFWVCRAGLKWVLGLTAGFLRSLRWLVRIPTGWQYASHTIPVILILGGLLLASPWLLDWLLKRCYRQQVLTVQTLKQTYPESSRLLGRITQQQGWLMPVMRELPSDAPLIFSYGWLPRYSRIVLSRGLLNRFNDDELATLIGYELTHISTRITPFMSLLAVLLQLFYQLYWQTARLGSRPVDRFTKITAAGLSALSYGLYWLIRKLAIPLSRTRVALGDRTAADWTGNPNALVRALLKLQAGVAETLQREAQTPPIIESTDLLTPIGYETAITLGSIFPSETFLELLKWDTQNPYRNWLSFNSSHPLLGDRIRRLSKQALQWQLRPEIPLEAITDPAASKVTFRGYWFPFLQQISPFISPLIGIVIAMILWFLGGLFRPLGVWQVSWLYGDRSLLPSGILIGIGIGTLLRINRYFPDVGPATRLSNPPLPSLIDDPMGLPTDSHPVRLKGKLLGRPGMANWLCQDLLLETPMGMVKLHFLSVLGAFGNLLMHPEHPANWVGRSVEVQGWLRRGAIAWMDADQILKSGKVVARSNHPVLAVVLSFTFFALGLWTILSG